MDSSPGRRHKPCFLNAPLVATTPATNVACATTNSIEKPAATRPTGSAESQSNRPGDVSQMSPPTHSRYLCGCPHADRLAGRPGSSPLDRLECYLSVQQTRPSTQPWRRPDATSTPTLRGSTTADATIQHSATAGPTTYTTVTPSQNWQRKQNRQLHWPESPQQPKGRIEARVRKVVLVNTDEFEKGRRRGEQIQRMQAYYGQQQRRRHLYNLGIVNIKRLNIIFHTHSEEYWRGYADGLHSRSSSRPS